MNTNGPLGHPEIMELLNICTVSPDASQEVCDYVKKMEVNASNAKEHLEQRKKDKELDRDLKDTFPASDPFTHY